MGVYFGAGSGVLRHNGTQLITGTPMTFSAWVFVAEGGAALGGRAVFLGGRTVDNLYFTMGIVNDLTALANCRNTTLTNVVTTNKARQGEWNHILATATTGGASSVRVILNGGLVGAGVGAGDTISTGIDRFALGVTDRLTPLGYWEGGLAVVGGWNVVLRDAEAIALSQGADPRGIRPMALRYFYPLHFGPNEADHMGPDLTYISGGAGPFPHPPVFLPLRRPGRRFEAAAALDDALLKPPLPHPSFPNVLLRR